ncbi:auxin-responsive protein IAA14-like [Miscanthus floridulus]|uniref:auxin-responsive protein IAA14-like n=1 Tax=Miscanthus floridulus TaxID=154761 RepID=UPI00345A090D
MEMIDAELRLGPPGSNSDVTVLQPARKPLASAAAKRPSSSVVKSEASVTDDHDDAAPASKVQVVGWPPVRAYRKNAFHAAAEARRTKGGEQGGLYVKVSMDGAPFLRKVDLRTYGGYRELRDALDALFGCFSSSSADGGCQFAIAYEDKDGDLMLAGDVPWEMFICSCKKLRIMRGSEAR